MFKIDIHTHIIPENLNTLTDTFSDPRFLRINSITDKTAMLIKDNKPFRQISCNCWNYHSRLKECTDSGVDIQVLSTIPILFSYWSSSNECLKLSQFLNNHIADICQKEPSRYMGLGTVPMQKADLAISEMDRCINKLKLPGIQIGSNINGLNLSEPAFDPIFEHAEKIGCSLFVHPWEMMGQLDMQKYWLPWLVGMPAEISRAICSLILGGVLEKYPNLKIAFAHGGGSFPFTAGRIDHGFTARPDLCAIDSTILPSSYMKNFYVDSLVHNKESLNFLIETMGKERIAMGSDYPFPLGEQLPGKMIESMDFSNATKQRLLAGTALEWLGLDESYHDE